MSDVEGAAPPSNATAVDASAPAVADPEIALIQSAVVPPGTPVAGTWNENANRDYYDTTMYLPWEHTLGDYLPTPLGSVQVPSLNSRTTISIPVTGNNFYIRNSGGGNAIFDSREAEEGTPPTLIVNGTKQYTATRDTVLNAGSVTAVGTSETLNDQGPMLIAFPFYTPQPGDTAVLHLTANHSYAPHTLTAYPTNVHYTFVNPGDVPGGTVVADIRASDFTTSNTISVSGDTVTGYWGGRSITALSQVFQVPPANEYFLTVMIKLEKDWVNWGGKLPGLSNTGLFVNHNSAPLIINGVDCSNAGWGGRIANGCRWSARTGWGGRVGYQVGMHSYFYAVAPQDGYGIVQSLQIPAPVGQWFAYVERVRVNTPGQNDGRLTYWVCTQAGCAAVLDRSDINWRSYDLPQSQINEVWADVYCGGTTCGPLPYARSTVDLKRLTVTTGLPDLTALYAEVEGLKGQ